MLGLLLGLLLVLMLGLMLGLSGCATPIDPGPAPARVERADLPFHPQLELQCGPAALATVLGGLGVDATPQALAEAVFLPGRRGSLQAEMLAGARRHGAVAVRLDATVDALLREVAAGVPVLVLQNLSLPLLPRWHYAVVIGYDAPRGELLLRSGEVERLRMSIATFDRTWARSGRWAFTVHRPGDWPVGIDEDRATEAAVGWQRVAAPAGAEAVWRSVLERWPGSLTAAIGLGQTHWDRRDWAAAERVWADAARRHHSATAWTNVAWARRALGDEAGVRAALTEAQALAPAGGAASVSAIAPSTVPAAVPSTVPPIGPGQPPGQGVRQTD